MIAPPAVIARIKRSGVPAPSRPRSRSLREGEDRARLVRRPRHNEKEPLHFSPTWLKKQGRDRSRPCWCYGNACAYGPGTAQAVLARQTTRRRLGKACPLAIDRFYRRSPYPRRAHARRVRRRATTAKCSRTTWLSPITLKPETLLFFSSPFSFDRMMVLLEPPSCS